MEKDPTERRKFIRMPVSIMIRLKSEEDGEEFVSNYTRDLSLGGVFLKSLSPKPLGTPVCIQLPSPEPPGYTEVQGKVVYQNTTIDDGLLAGMGIEFVKMGNGARGILQRFIDNSWRELFKVLEDPTEDAVVGAIQTFVGLTNFVMNFVHRSRVLSPKC